VSGSKNISRGTAHKKIDDSAVPKPTNNVA